MLAIENFPGFEALDHALVHLFNADKDQEAYRLVDYVNTLTTRHVLVEGVAQPVDRVFGWNGTALTVFGKPTAFEALPPKAPMPIPERPSSDDHLFKEIAGWPMNTSFRNMPGLHGPAALVAWAEAHSQLADLDFYGLDEIDYARHAHEHCLARHRMLVVVQESRYYRVPEHLNWPTVSRELYHPDAWRWHDDALYLGDIEIEDFWASGADVNDGAITFDGCHQRVVVDFIDPDGNQIPECVDYCGNIVDFRSDPIPFDPTIDHTGVDALRAAALYSGDPELQKFVNCLNGRDVSMNTGHNHMASTHATWEGRELFLGEMCLGNMLCEQESEFFPDSEKFHLIDYDQCERPCKFVLQAA